MHAAVSAVLRPLYYRVVGELYAHAVTQKSLLCCCLQAIMAVRRELPVWQQLRRLLLTGSLLGDA